MNDKFHITDSQWQEYFFLRNLWLQRVWKITILFNQRFIINVAIFRLSMLNGKLLMFFFLHPNKNDLHASLVYAVLKSTFCGGIPYLEIILYCFVVACNANNTVKHLLQLNIWWFFSLLWTQKNIFHDSIFNIFDFPSIFRFSQTIFGNYYYIRGKDHSILMEIQNHPFVFTMAEE